MAKKDKTLEQEAVELLREARRLNNLTVIEARDVAKWHRAVDQLLRLHGIRELDAEYDAPHRKEHRDFVRGITHGH